MRLSPAEVKGEITVEDVSFGYQSGQSVLRNISFTIGPGDMLAVVGRTGSGKSTLLRLLARLYDTDSGRVLLDGHDIRQLDLADLRAAVALVSQETYLFEGTIRDNLRYGKPDATDEELLTAMSQAGAADLIERLPEGLDTSVGERGTRLSSGERQRVAIARSILRNANVWLLDEITAHLDYETEHAIQLSIQEIASDRTTVVVTHRLATIRYAKRILVLDDGKIAESGTHDELLTLGGLYAGLWRLQSGGEAGAPRPRRRTRPSRKHPAPK
ncbi:MAG: ATP-binding cassette domain-containing protein [Acetobacteraceae bacterium]|nr:ATP-binding cassette domain-containing protein [Acetobacteraceae bacterium]